MKKILNYILILIMIIYDIYIIIYNLNIGCTSRILTYLSLFPVLVIPLIIEKITNKKLPNKYKTIYYIFVFISMFLGCIINFYKSIWWFDDFAHYISGLLSTALAYLIYKNYCKCGNLFIKITYLAGFMFMIAGLWEMFEFGLDQILKTNTQHAIESGVVDTMTDIIDSTLGFITYFIFNKPIKKFLD